MKNKYTSNPFPSWFTLKETENGVGVAFFSSSWLFALFFKNLEIKRFQFYHLSGVKEVENVFGGKLGQFPIGKSKQIDIQEWFGCKIHKTHAHQK